MRRFIALLIALAPFVIVALFASRPDLAVRSAGGYVLIGLGALVVWLNVYTSWIRPLAHLRRGGTREDYRHASGLPIVGTVLLTIGQGLAAVPWPWAAALLTALVLDTGGPIWFMISTWRDRELWSGG